MPTKPPPKRRTASAIELAERRSKLAKLCIAGWGPERIYREGGLGYGSRQHVHRDMKIVLEALLKEQNELAHTMRAVSLERLERAINVATEIMEREHLAHSGGNLVSYVDPTTGEEIRLHDSGPQLSAANTLRQLEESKRKLLGIDAPTKVEQTVDGTVKYVVEVAADEMEQL